MRRQLTTWLKTFARRKTLAIALIGLAPLVLRAMLLPWFGAPHPRVQDEFSHLLVADTFAEGRMVNPVHPMWAHFESMHILVRPVYASPFPIAQGLIMAAGQIVNGHPWAGVWISVGLMCAALCWMLQGWVSPGWALLGGALAAVRFGVLSYWMDSYYGGAMGALGGALVLGAMGRMMRRSNWGDGVVMGAGFAILANSRPYEGFVFSLPVAVTLIWVVRRRLAILLPLIFILAATAAAMAYYCARVTGNPLQLPYSLYRSSTMAPHFLWQSPRPEPLYLHRVLHDYHAGWEMGCYNDAIADRPPRGVVDKAKSYWRFYLGPFLTIPLLAIPLLWRRRRGRFLLVTGSLVSAGLAVEVWHAPHYAAPAAGLAMLLVIESLRQMRQTAAAFLVPVAVLGCLLTPVIDGSGQSPGGQDRARILKRLESAEGRHLVLVRYPLSHDVGDEWVYNRADIDNAKVVWAREMDPGSNRALLSYFQARHAWLIEPDNRPVTLAPYDPSVAPDPLFRFIPLGTEAIEALRSPEEVRRKVLGKVRNEYPKPFLFNCDQWSFFFTAVTGVQPPDTSRGCFPPGRRAAPVSFEEWFAWLGKQR